jgi:hypothetical protein
MRTREIHLHSHHSWASGLLRAQSGGVIECVAVTAERSRVKSMQSGSRTPPTSKITPSRRYSVSTGYAAITAHVLPPLGASCPAVKPACVNYTRFDHQMKANTPIGRHAVDLYMQHTCRP